MHASVKRAIKVTINRTLSLKVDILRDRLAHYIRRRAQGCARAAIARVARLDWFVLNPGNAPTSYPASLSNRIDRVEQAFCEAKYRISISFWTS